MENASLAPALTYWLPSSVTFVSILAVVIILAAKWYVKHRTFVKIVDKIPGPIPVPIFGNALELYGPPEELFKKVIEWHNTYGRGNPLFRIWIGHSPIVLLTSPDAAEAVLGSNKHIMKSREYNFLLPWLGTGLLTSTGEKWHLRRKLLTPAFHFKILEDFVDVFNEKSLILVEKLRSAMSKDTNTTVDIFPYITRCTLDTICNTAMGKDVDAQNNQNSDYVRAVHKIGSIVQARQVRPWLQPEFLFNVTPLGTEHKHSLKVLHEFTNQVIRERKLANEKRNATLESQSNVTNENEDFFMKKRLAFLDLLIAASDGGRALSDDDIREEVDTFMFEGHDTTAAGINWCLFLIGTYPEVQERVYEEIVDVLGNDLNKPVTMQDLPKLKYLDCCIKEAQRLYPSVPMLGREIKEDLIIDGYTIPAGCTVMLCTYMLHRNPSIFPDPEAFMPERFFTENCVGRHPYAYVPFSAGPRNCIGQKFAVMEEKVVLATVFRHFYLKSLEKRENIELLSELILRPKRSLSVGLTLRRASE